MKRTEIAMIILIAGLSMISTFFIARSFFGDKVKREATIEEVQEISTTIIEPSKLIFNDKAINPTVEVYVEDEISTSFENANTAQKDNKSTSETKPEADKPEGQP